MAHGQVFIVSAPSGAGKTSLVKALLEADAGLCTSVSYTSRPARPGEVDGVHYHFVSQARFEAMIAESAFFECAEVHGDYKGTAKHVIADLLDAGRDVVLEIDWQGAEQVRALIPEAVGIFILPPSRAELERRLTTRGQDDAAVIAQRLANAADEVRHAGEYDYLLVNDDFDEALAALCAIVTAERQRIARQKITHAHLLNELTNAQGVTG